MVIRLDLQSPSISSQQQIHRVELKQL